jgi:hypothetical protein
MFEESINPLILIVILYVVVQLAILIYFFFENQVVENVQVVETLTVPVPKEACF